MFLPVRRSGKAAAQSFDQRVETGGFHESWRWPPTPSAEAINRLEQKKTNPTRLKSSTIFPACGRGAQKVMSLQFLHNENCGFFEAAPCLAACAMIKTTAFVLTSDLKPRSTLANL